MRLPYVILLLHVILYSSFAQAHQNEKPLCKVVDEFEISWKHTIRTITLSPDGKTLLALGLANRRGIVAAWDIEERKQIAEIVLKPTIPAPYVQLEGENFQPPIMNPIFRYGSSWWLDNQRFLIKLEQIGLYCINIRQKKYWRVKDQLKQTIASDIQGFLRKSKILFTRAGKFYQSDTNWESLNIHEYLEEDFLNYNNVRAISPFERYLVVQEKYNKQQVETFSIYKYRTWNPPEINIFNPVLSYQRDRKTGLYDKFHFVPYQTILMFELEKKYLLWWDFEKNEIINSIPPLHASPLEQANTQYIDFKLSPDESIYAVNFGNRPMELRNLKSRELLFKGPIVFESRNYAITGTPLRLAVSTNSTKVKVYYLEDK
ncbi:Hypothetical protein PBC10988_8020 [Planctomycetales bacterium 10988]|nr:Hypothetical protein PBC10988_8020 [Planctomycetales bacterium 10988]